MSTTISKVEFEKLLSSPKEEKWREAVEFRKANKEWLSLSSDIALKVMDQMDKQGIRTNKQLAALMNVSPQQVSKILKGRENLTLETIAKINQALGVKIVAIPSEDEILVKNDMKTLIMLTKEILEQHIKLNLQEVSQKKQEVKVSDQPAIEYDFSFNSGYVNNVPKRNIKSGESNYAMAA